VEFVGSFAQLRERAGELREPFDPHRPYIDEYAWPCAEAGCEGTMRRTPEVIDAWFDSGAMPFAKWHYPFENQEEAETLFPADFICEGVDQTRGWFYSLLAISTLLDRGPAFRNVVVNDMVLDAEGQKMSKSRGNIVDPWEALGDFGADAIRWYLLASSHPWLPKRFDPAGVREVQRKVFDTLRSSYHFFSLYANAEGWRPSPEDAPPAERPIMDRWLLSRLAELTSGVTEQMDAYNLTRATRTLGDFIVDDLSNWYVRRSRERFWGSGDSQDTRAAFATLHRGLGEVALLAAPFAPFLADWLHRSLAEGRSAHLSRLTAVDPSLRDPSLDRGMEAVRTLATLGRAARERVKIRVRQPLEVLYAVVPDVDDLDDELLAILRDELNVRRVEFMKRAEELVTFTAKPNFKVIGARFGSRTQQAATAIRALSSAELAAYHGGEALQVSVEGELVELTALDLDLVQESRGELVVEASGGYTVALDATLTPELRAEGLAREAVNRVQRLRKDAGLDVSDRIRLGIACGEMLAQALEVHRSFIAGETLAVELEVTLGELAPGTYQEIREVDLDGEPAVIGLSRASVAGGAA
jgi:isoleucyl-tRNA synthetase